MGAHLFEDYRVGSCKWCSRAGDYPIWHPAPGEQTGETLVFIGTLPLIVDETSECYKIFMWARRTWAHSRAPSPGLLNVFSFIRTAVSRLQNSTIYSRTHAVLSKMIWCWLSVRKLERSCRASSSNSSVVLHMMMANNNNLQVSFPSFPNVLCHSLTMYFLWKVQYCQCGFCCILGYVQI